MLKVILKLLLPLGILLLNLSVLLRAEPRPVPVNGCSERKANATGANGSEGARSQQLRWPVPAVRR